MEKTKIRITEILVSLVAIFSPQRNFDYDLTTIIMPQSN